MKKFIKYLFVFTIATTLGALPSIIKSDYCDGWENGYEEGWCYNQGYNCLTPLIPLCPLPYLYKETYQDGYNRGFIKGREDYED